MYEIEIKSLLGSKEAADRLLETLKRKDPDLVKVGENSQLNHYFVGGNREKLQKIMQKYISREEGEKLAEILSEAKELSIRTRKADSLVLFVLKASIDDTTSSNGTARIEFEVPVSLAIDELDNLLLESDCDVQAKWSRERKEYALQDGTHICFDRNAGYGYLVEFERVVKDASQSEEVKKELRSLMEELHVKELPQDRLARMFEHYNAHWEEYYGTEKTFEIQ